MLFKLSILAVLAPLANALTFNAPVNITSAGSATITWTSDPTDPPMWNLYLLNTVFHDSFGIANNVQTDAGTITLQLPVVPPGDGYTLEGTNVSNITLVYGTSPTFSIGAIISTTASSSSTVSSSGTVSISPTISPSSGSSSPSSVSPTSNSAGSSGASSTGSSTSSSSTASPTTFNGSGSNGAVSDSAGSWLAMVVAAIAGGAFAL